MEIIAISILCILMMVNIGVTIWVAHRDTILRANMFQVQMEQAAAQADMRSPLTYQEIRAIIVNIYLIETGLAKKKEDELSLLIDDALEDLCVNIEMSLGADTKRQWEKITGPTYLSWYIQHSTQIILVDAIERRGGGTMGRYARHLNQTNQENQAGPTEPTKREYQLATLVLSSFPKFSLYRRTPYLF